MIFKNFRNANIRWNVRFEVREKESELLCLLICHIHGAEKKHFR